MRDLLFWALVSSLMWGAWSVAWKFTFPNADMGAKQYFLTWLLAVGTFFVIGRFRRKPK